MLMLFSVISGKEGDVRITRRRCKKNETEDVRGSLLGFT